MSNQRLSTAKLVDRLIPEVDQQILVRLTAGGAPETLVYVGRPAGTSRMSTILAGGGRPVRLALGMVHGVDSADSEPGIN